MNERTPITDAELQAYVDQELSPERRVEVESYLVLNPEAAAKVDAYQKMNQDLHALFDHVIDEPLPETISLVPRPKPRIWRVAAVSAWLSIGGLIGWMTHAGMVSSIDVASVLQTDLAKPAAFAHVIYANEVRHPVEVPAEQEQHLVTWLSKRLHTDIQAPNLSNSGFELIGGRLLPSTNRMAAQFMYQRPSGDRVTLYVRRGAWNNDVSAFKYEANNDIGVFYWIDGPLGYALVGELNRDELFALSEAVFKQFN